MKQFIFLTIFLSSFFGFTQKDTNEIIVTDECIDIYETPAAFYGGIEAFQNWFSDEVLKIKSISKYDLIKGKVQFIIHWDGSVVDVKIIEINNIEVSKSIIEILEKSPKWKPKARHFADYRPRLMKERFELPFEIRIK